MPKKKSSKKYGRTPKIKEVKPSPKIKRVKQEDMFTQERRRSDVLSKAQLDAAKLARHQSHTAAKKRGVTDIKKLKKIGNAAADKAQDDIVRAVKKKWAKLKVKEASPLNFPKRAERIKVKKAKKKKK